ncbi:hypothetical protein NIM86_10830 [Notoacmeibacter sp. MSK16QG-6]|nr:hypothetical protein [Notoacmeibacter sp. MSK16QG-6]
MQRRYLCVGRPRRKIIRFIPDAGRCAPGLLISYRKAIALSTRSKIVACHCVNDETDCSRGGTVPPVLPTLALAV